MKYKSLLLAIPFFFLIVNITPALAYLDIDTNVTYSGGLSNNAYILCSNVTGTQYCYKLGTPSGSYPHRYIERYNATWGDRHYCDTGISFPLGSIDGAFIANATYFAIHQWSAPGTFFFDISNMTNSTDCSGYYVVYDVNSSLNETYPSLPVAYTGGYYNINGDGVSGFVYYPGTNGRRNSTTLEYNASSYWDTDYLSGLRLPNQKNDSVVFGYYGGIFFKYVNGVFAGNTIQALPTWGFDFQGYNFDMWEESASTTWLYAFDGARLYRVNYSEAEILGDAYITPVYPISETIGDTTPELHAIVYSNNSGYVAWYVDGVFKTNETITPSGSNATDVYYTTAALSEAAHNWSAVFYPDGAYSFDTGTLTFTIDTAYAGSDYTGADSMDDLKNYMDSGFQSPYGSEIFALIIAGIFGGLFFYYSRSKKLEIFIAPFFLILGIFSLLGFFPLWFLFLEAMFIGLIIFFKVR